MRCGRKRKKKRAESRARECNYFRVELARGTGCYGQEWSKRRDGRNKEGGKWDCTKEFEKVLQDGQENNWRVDVAHLSDEKIRSSRRQIPRRFRTQYSANHKIVADLTSADLSDTTHSQIYLRTTLDQSPTRQFVLWPSCLSQTSFVLEAIVSQIKETKTFNERPPFSARILSTVVIGYHPFPRGVLCKDQPPSSVGWLPQSLRSHPGRSRGRLEACTCVENSWIGECRHKLCFQAD